MMRTPPNGRSPGRFDLNSSEFVPQSAWNGDQTSAGLRDIHPQRSGSYFVESSHASTFLPGTSYVPTSEYVPHGTYYNGPRSHETYETGYASREIIPAAAFEYRAPYVRDSQPYTPRVKSGGHKRYNSNDYERIVLSRSRIQDFASKIPDLCRDQNGCRHLQGELDSRDEETIEVIFNGAKPYFPDLMSDPFGNYLCQKLLETCNDTQRTELVRIVAPTMVSISLNQHGTRAVQKLLDHLTLPEQVYCLENGLIVD
jgi:hypothetical protein